MLGPEFTFHGLTISTEEPPGGKVVIKRTDPIDLNALLATKAAKKLPTTRLYVLESIRQNTKMQRQLVAILIVAALLNRFLNQGVVSKTV